MPDVKVYNIDKKDEVRKEGNKVVVPLKYPIVMDKPGIGEINIKEVSFGTRLKNKHVRHLPRDIFLESNSVNPFSMIKFMSAVLNITEEQVDEIDMEDMTTIWEELAPFLEQLAETGKK